MNENAPLINFEHLFKLRLVVARHGEMDAARWWNSHGVLGRRGAVVFKRGFPTTHMFAQARVAFEVARARCRELFDPPASMTLWNLPATIEDQFEVQWQSWLDDTEKWTAVFQVIETQDGTDLLKAMSELDLLSQMDLDAVGKLRRSAENRAVPVPGIYLPSNPIITLLAAAFSRSEPGSPAIPYAKLEA